MKSCCHLVLQKIDSFSWAHISCRRKGRHWRQWDTSWMLSRTHSLNNTPIRTRIFQVEKLLIFIFSSNILWLVNFQFSWNNPYSNDHIWIDAVSVKQNFELFWVENLEALLGRVCGTDIRSCVGDKCEDPLFHWLTAMLASDWDCDPGTW